jgi:glutamate carboxypeptidase
MIPPNAQAQATCACCRSPTTTASRRQVRERIKTKLLPDIQGRRDLRAPAAARGSTPASRALAKHAQQIYRELGKDLWSTRWRKAAAPTPPSRARDQGDR